MNHDIATEIEKTNAVDKVVTLETEFNDDSIINTLATLSDLEYERQRESAAEQLGIKRISILDKLVKHRRLALDADTENNELTQGIIPWEHPVNGQALAATIINTFHRYTILPNGGAIALTLWSLGSYCFNAFRIFPKLCLSSPEKRCGKTTTMETLAALVHRKLMASNVSSATLFRSIECWQPSLLIDEGDTFIDGNEELRGIINSGHTKSGATVLRCTGDDHEPKPFSTWAPMAIAMIKTPPDTIKDRSVMITLRRKMPGETITRLPIDLFAEFKTHRQQCQRWAHNNMDTLKQAEPDTPSVGSDRAEDNWRALLAIADQLGGEWPTQARKAMLIFEGNKDCDDEGIGPMILGDIKIIFEEKGLDKISSEELVNILIDLEERPWGEWKHGKPMTKTSLARRLKPYAIKSKKIRIHCDTKRGYTLDSFKDAFTRYLTPQTEHLLHPSVSSGTPEQTSNHVACSVPLSNNVPPPTGTQQQNGTLQASKDAACSTVPLETGGIEASTTQSEKREIFEL
ncbi:DUF3631 domain-containing protein [bacterium AH-315-K03]|nr:DUF3631 domain-containing protein [bacterium AH-315-K03]